MLVKAWIILLGLVGVALPTAANARSFECGNFPLLGDAVPEAERAEQLQKRAFKCAQSGRPLEAVVLFSELIGQQPENVSAYLNRGSAYLQARQFEAGVADFSHVIALRPTDFVMSSAATMKSEALPTKLVMTRVLRAWSIAV